MEIDNIMTNIFAHKPKVQSQTKDTSNFELNKLQFQMQEHNRKNKKKYNTKLFNYNNETSYDEETLNDSINIEIARSKTKSGWKLMPKTYKWDLVCKYLTKYSEENKLSDLDIADKKKIVKTMIMSGCDNNIKYCNQSKEIINIIF